MRRVFVGLALLVILAGAPIVIVALFGRAFLYHPTRDAAAALARDGWRAERIARPEGISLAGLVRPGSPSAPWLVLFGGNAMSLGASRWVLERCAAGAESWGLVTFAYRGYDGSGGEPAQPEILRDAEAVVAWLEATHGVLPSRLVVMGQSLGSGVAAHVAAALARGGRPAAATVLVSPYTSMARVFDEQVPVIPVGWAAPDPYRTDRLVGDLAAPLLLLHGGADTLIRPEHSRTLAQMLGERAHLVELAELSHNDMWDDPRTLEAVRTLVRGVVR